MRPEVHLASSGVVLFTTPDCPHCPNVRMLSEREAVEKHEVPFTEVSAPDQPHLASSMNVRAAPTAIAMFNGVEVDRVVGPANQSEVERVFASASGASNGSRSRISAENRKFRTAIGAVLVIAGLIASVIWLVLIGAAFTASGWWDKLPIPGSRSVSRLGG